MFFHGEKLRYCSSRAAFLAISFTFLPSPLGEDPRKRGRGSPEAGPLRTTAAAPAPTIGARGGAGVPTAAGSAGDWVSNLRLPGAERGPLPSPPRGPGDRADCLLGPDQCQA